MAVKLTRPSEKWQRPETPTYQKLAFAGAICMAVGIQRRVFLLLGAVLLVLAWFSHRADSQRLS